MISHPAAGPGVIRPAVQRWRLVITIQPEDADSGRGVRQVAWEAGLRECGLPIAGLDADPPRPRTMAAAPLAASIRGDAELVDVWLVERVPRWRVREALDRVMPPGQALLDVFDVWLGEAPLPGRVIASVYRVELPAGLDIAAIRAATEAMLAAPALRRERRKGEGSVAYDLRLFIETLEMGAVTGAGTVDLRLTLRHDPERGIGRPDEVIAELGDRLGSRPTPVVIARERLVLGPERVAPATTPGKGSRREGPRVTAAR